MFSAVKKGITYFRENKNKPNVKINYVYNLIYKVLSLLIPLVTTPYLTSLLSASGIGQINYINTYSVYFVLLANLGFNYYSQRLISSSRNNKHERSKIFFETLIARSITTSLSLAIYILLASFSVYGNQYDTLVWIYLIPIASVFFDVSFYLTGIENFRTIVFRDTIIKITGTILIFSLVKESSDVWIYALILSATSFVSAISVIPSLIKEIEFVKVSELKWRRHLKESFILFLPLAASSIYPYIDKTIIGLFVTDGEVGCYSKAEQITSTAAAFVTSLGIVVSPRNSLLFSEGKLDEVKKMVYKAMRFIFMIGIPLCLGLIAISNLMIGWYIKGDGFDNFVFVILILSFTIILLGFRNVLGVQYLIPTKNDKSFAFCIVAGLTVNVGLSILFALIFKNSIGVALATLISEFVICLLLYLLAKKDFSLKEFFKDSWKYFIAGAAMFAICFLLTQKMLSHTLSHTLIAILVGGMIYFLTLISLNDSLTISYKDIFLNNCFKLVENKKYQSVVKIIFIAVVFLSVLSYSPFLLAINLNKYVYLAWILLTCVCIPLIGVQIKDISLISVFLFFPFLIFVFIISLTTAEKTIFSTFVRLVFISGYLLVNGYALGKICDKKTISKALTGVFIASLIAGFNIFFAYFRNFSFSERIYRYSGKNEISCFLLMSVCFASFLKPKELIIKIGMIVSAAFMMFLLVMMKARAVLIVVPFLFIYELTNKKFKGKYRLIVGISALVFIAIVFFVPQIRDIIVNQIIFASRKSSDIDDISSNRFTYIYEALEIFKLSPLIGVGNYYVDSGPIQILTCFGIMGTILLMPALFLPFFSLYNNLKAPSYFKRLLTMFVLIFYINHLFEAYPPFGPGIKTFLLWVFSGIALNNSSFKKEINQSNYSNMYFCLEI